MRKDLTEIIYKYRNHDFSWEEFDCCIFTAQVVEEYTGRTLPHWRDVIDYKSFTGAMKALKKLGCKDITDLPEVILGNPKKPISEVKLGEPVYFVREEDGVGILGVCNGARAYFLANVGGLTARPIEDCEYCWSIK